MKHMKEAASMTRHKPNKTLRMVLGTLSLVAGGVLLLSYNNSPDSLPDTVPPPQVEMHMKHSQVTEDVNLTEGLCRSQCTLDFRRVIQELQASSLSNDQLQSKLEQLKQEHPHMHQLTWVPKDRADAKQAVTTGDMPEEHRNVIERYYDEAKDAADRGLDYQSPRIGSGQSQYFVLGVPSLDGKAALLGVIHQDILDKVEAHQRKNLRVVEYPDDKRWKIEAVDSDTLNKVEVDHPEENEGVSHYYQQEVVVGFENDPSEQELERIKSDIGASHVQKLGYTYVFQSQSKNAKEMMAYFQSYGVRYAEPHFLYITNDNGMSSTASNGTTEQGFIPNDVLYSRYQWNLPQIETPEGWNVTRGNKDVIVAVVDTGVDIEHPDLKPNTIEGLNLVNEGQAPMDDVGHGTHVAGVISALINNNEGVAGMTWHNPVMPIKALDHTGAGSTYTVAQGIIWATDHGAKVINMSLGNYADARFLHDAVRYAFDHDVVLIAASGNDNTEQPGYPAAYPEVFAVAATDSKQQKASFSNYGDYIDAAAPGVSIASTYPNNQYAALSGTSMASPHVSALAALIRSVNPALRNTDVMEIMRRTAIDLGAQGKDKYYGYGLIDVEGALSQARKANDSMALTTRQIEQEVTKLEQKYKKIAH
jgi:thermitase